MPFSSILPTTVSRTPSTLSKELRARSSMVRAVAETIVSASLRKTENSDQVQIARPPRMMVKARANMILAGARTYLRSEPLTVAKPRSRRDRDVTKTQRRFKSGVPRSVCLKLTERAARRLRPARQISVEVSIAATGARLAKERDGSGSDATNRRADHRHYRDSP